MSRPISNSLFFRRRAPGARTVLKPSGLLVAAALMLSGIAVSQGVGQTGIVPQAQAAPIGGKIDIPLYDYPFGPYSMRTYTGPNYFSNPIRVDDDTVYAVGPQGPGFVGKFTPDADGIIRNNTLTPISASYGKENVLDWTTAPWMDTVAIDGGGYDASRERGTYVWGYYGVSYPKSVSNPPAGQPEWTWPVYWVPNGATRPAKIFFVPQAGFMDPSGKPRQNARGVGGANLPSGEIDQTNGYLYMAGSECSNINGNFRMMVFDPATGRYNLSQKLVPNTPGDMLFMSKTDACAGEGYVASDTAVDAQGNAYIMVISKTPSRWNPAGYWGYYLVKVTPGVPGNWRYSIVTWLDGTGRSSTAYTYSMAFYNGYLYAYRYQGNDTLLRINPITGQTAVMPNMTVLNNGIAQGGDKGYMHDYASMQPAPVVTGIVYNDVDADGSIAGDPGVGQVLVGLYDNNGALIGTQYTSDSGSYSFLLPGTKNVDFSVRVIQPRLKAADGTVINAVQTYADGSAGDNSVTPQCFNGPPAAGTGGPCYGQLPPPYADPPAGSTGSVMNPAAMPIVTKVRMTTSYEVAVADFGITVKGSYGDAKAGPTGANVPVHVNVASAPVQLGPTLGSYNGPATDNSHTTDDGVYIDSYAGPLSMADTILASTKAYQLGADVLGSDWSHATVTGWTTGANNDTWSTASWNPAVTASGAGGKAAGPYQFQPSGTVTGTPAVQMRVNASNVPQTLPTNANGQYQAGASGSPYWATPGEIEDYTFKVADAVYRPAAKTTAGSGTFLVDNTSITADTTLVVGPAKAVAAGTPVALTAKVPDLTWMVTDVTIKDTVTGAVVATPALSVAADGTATFSYTPATGSDVIVEVTYGPGGLSPTLSTFEVSPVPDPWNRNTWVLADGVSAYTATLTAKNDYGILLPSLDVADMVFTCSNPDVTVSAVTNNNDGTYTVTYTSTVVVLDAMAQVTYQGTPIGTPAPVLFA